MLQNVKNGNTEITEVPVPRCADNEVLIRVNRSAISIGTERMIVNFGKSSYINKAKQQPEKVKMVLDKIKTDGLQPTVQAVRSKLNEPMPLGYSVAGVVEKVGKNVNDYVVGDRVIASANHAEYVSVNRNLVHRIPDNVSDDEAAFTVIATIALQGVRVLSPKLGDKVIVIGLGLIGQITLDLLHCNGCEAIGLDIEEGKLAQARSRGFEAFNAASSHIQDTINHLTNGVGADAVIITAATQNNIPITQAIEFCRKKGQIVAVGAVKMDVPRELFYKKELSLLISTSTGPGRYDPQYEIQGIDYPIGYVRWTENRNFGAILSLLSAKKLDFTYLVSSRYQFENISSAYETMVSDSESLGYLVEYSEEPAALPSQTLNLSAGNLGSATAINAALIGAGNYAKQVLSKVIVENPNIAINAVVSAKGVSGTALAKKVKAKVSTTDADRILEDSAINTAIITTQHHSHAKFICKALRQGKHVFVEKPLCLNLTELADILKAMEFARVNAEAPQLMVGFNRRFSPFTKFIQQQIKGLEDKLSITMVINAGFIPSDSWVHQPDQGGGRFIGEGCHFVDLASALTGSEIEKVYSTCVPSEKVAMANDNVQVSITYKNGSVATIHYFSSGNKSFPKETVLVSGGGKVFELDNWRKLTGYGAASFSKRGQHKGQKEEMQAFVDAIKNAYEAIPLASLVNTTLATFAHVESLNTGQAVSLSSLYERLAVLTQKQ